MRKNLFLHYLNRDSREIFELQRFYADSQHSALLKEALNASILLCEDHCVIPPGFAIEDEIAFDLSEVNQQFFSSRRILLPMREASLEEYADKKRLEYLPQRDRYSGLFSDRRLDFLGKQAAVGIIPRRARIGEEIVKSWESGADSRSVPWDRVKRLLRPKEIEIVRGVPGILTENGHAVVWSQIARSLPPEAQIAHGDLRNSLQHIYFKQYCGEFSLEVLSELPFRCDEFGLASERSVYSFSRFAEFLSVFSLRRLLLRCSALTLCEAKLKPGMTQFVDAYQGVARKAKSRADLLLIANKALQASTFGWKAFEVRHELLIAEPNGLALAEMDDALTELAEILTVQNGVPVRFEGPPRTGEDVPKKNSGKSSRKTEVAFMSDLVIYVALDEELETLVKHWKLTRNHKQPAASGEIGGLSVDVLSPKSMGRVPAAVEVARYLAGRGERRPKLILVVGLAGGFKEEEIEEGHILCATTVVDLASRKIHDTDEATNTRFRRRDFPLDGALAEVLRASFDEEAWQRVAIDKADWPKGRRPSLHYGAVASVDEVVASDELRKKFLAAAEKLLGVEMEAGGVCAAAEVFKVPVVMLRAVSDGADPVKTNTEWRKRGM